MNEKPESLTRRRFITYGAAAAGTASVFASTSAESQSKPPLNLKLITNSDAAFAAHMNKHYPGLLEDPKFQPLLPMAILLVHQSGAPVRAFTVVWTLTNDMDQIEIPQFKMAPARSKGTKINRSGVQRKVKTAIAGQRDVIQRSSLMLFTPFFSLTPITYKHNPQEWHSLVKKSEPGAYIASCLSEGSKLSASLDAVLNKNKVVQGPDVYRLRWRFTARRRGERAQAREIYELLEAGRISDAEALLNQRATSIRRIGHTYTDWYFEARRGYAQQLLKSASLLSPDQFKRLVAVAAKAKLLSLRKPKHAA